VPGMGKRIALDVARGMYFLHSHRIIHFDIKTPNVRGARSQHADGNLCKELGAKWECSCTACGDSRTHTSRLLGMLIL